jgi:hypothetical protein
MDPKEELLVENTKGIQDYWESVGRLIKCS